MNIKNKIKELTKDKNQTFSLIAEFLLTYKGYEDLKIKDIIMECHVSSSGVIRFCKELNFNGFTELKYQLVFDEKNRDFEYLERFNMSSSADKHLNEIAISMMETRDLLSSDALYSIVEWIDETNEILVYGMGSSYIVALDMELKFSRIKKNIKAINDMNLQYFSSKNANDKSLVIGICYSGETQEVINNLKLAKNEDARVILITRESNIHFKDDFDLVIYVHGSEAIESRISATSRLTMLYIVDLIYFTYVDNNLESVRKILNKNNRI